MAALFRDAPNLHLLAEHGFHHRRPPRHKSHFNDMTSGSRAAVRARTGSFDSPHLTGRPHISGGGSYDAAGGSINSSGSGSSSTSARIPQHGQSRTRGMGGAGGKGKAGGLAGGHPAKASLVTGWETIRLALDNSWRSVAMQIMNVRVVLLRRRSLQRSLLVFGAIRPDGCTPCVLRHVCT